MHATLPLLESFYFPAIWRDRLETLQVNLGYLCNQSCVHCHVNAGPKRREIMDLDTVEEVIRFVLEHRIQKVDLTGGAPEMNPHFRHLVLSLREGNVKVIDRCNLTILEQPGFTDLPQFLADQRVEIIASLPCYLEENVDRQRGQGVFASSLRMLEELNRLGYAQPGTGLFLNLVYNPQGPVLPPPQEALERSYRAYLEGQFGVSFNHLYTLANMPIQRFGSSLISKGQFDTYLKLLQQGHRGDNLESVMCRTTLSVDWQGFVYDCDFNQMLNLPLGGARPEKIRLRDLEFSTLENRPIRVAGHCYGCTAGQGSSCGGALDKAPSG